MADNLTAGNPRAHAVRVYYFGGSTIYEGMPVCYDNSTTNWFGGSVADTGEVTESLTTAEGSQNEGKYIRVENPNADNVSLFAGVVKRGGWVGKTGPVVLDIYIPNGAVVPVRTDSNCLIDQTILAITTASQELGVPLETDSRPVAIARETIDRTTAGLVLAELCPDRFIHQDLGGTPLSIDDADTTTATLVNSMNLKFLGTGTYQKGLYAVGEVAGAGACAYGMWKFRTYLSAAAKANVHTLCANLHLKDDAELTNTPEFANSALYVTVETEYTAAHPDLSGGSLAAMYIGYYVNESIAGPAEAYAFWFNSHPTYHWDGLLKLQAASDLSGYVATGTVAFSATDVVIPVQIGGGTYYLCAFVDTGL